jgi:magnesium transporter
MRDMLLATPDTPLNAIMLKDPYYFEQDMELDEALKAAVGRHYPVYPVCDRTGCCRG